MPFKAEQHDARISSRMNVSSLKASWHTFLEHAHSKHHLKRLSHLLTLAILAYLAYRLTQTGWGLILASLPTHPLFYLLFFIIYLTLPLSETWLYGLVWPIGFRESLFGLLRKRVYNEEMLGYSGEVYLYVWAKQRISNPAVPIFPAIKDNNIVSTVASTSVAFSLTALLIYTGQIEITQWFRRVDVVYVITGVVLALLIVGLVVTLRKHLFSLPRKTLSAFLGIHLTRLLLANTLLVVQWMIVVPGLPLGVWFTYLATLIILNRIPFLPSKDLFFLGASVELSALMGVATSAVASMLLVSSILARVTNLTLFAITHYGEKKYGPKQQQDLQELSPSDTL